MNLSYRLTYMDFHRQKSLLMVHFTLGRLFESYHYPPCYWNV